MKNILLSLQRKSEQNEISVWLYDETVKALDEANSSEMTYFYIVENHKEDLINK